MIQIDQKNISSKLSEPGSNSSHGRSLTYEEITKINRLVESLDVSRLEALEIPSNHYASDRAQITTLRIETIGEVTYVSPMFDRRNPPQEIKKIVEYIREQALKE